MTDEARMADHEAWVRETMRLASVWKDSAVTMLAFPDRYETGEADRNRTALEAHLRTVTAPEPAEASTHVIMGFDGYLYEAKIDKRLDQPPVAAAQSLGAFKAAFEDVFGAHEAPDPAADLGAAEALACDEPEECDRLRGVMSDILRRTVNALRGEPPPLTLWSWHDLPERAAAAIAAIDVMQRVALAGSRQPAGREPWPVPGAVWEDDGVSMIRRGTEDQRCAERGSQRLYLLAAAPPVPAPGAGTGEKT